MPDLNGVMQAVCQQILGGVTTVELSSLEAAALDRAVLRAGLTIAADGTWNFAVPPTFAGGSGIPSAHHTTHELGGSDPVQLDVTQVTALAFNLNFLQSTKANLLSPTFVGTPSGPTAASGTATTQLATTAFVAQINLGQVTLVDGPVVALDPSTRASVYRLDALGDRVLSIGLPGVAGQKVVIYHVASGGPRTLTLTTGAGNQCRLPTSIVITTTTSGTGDYIGVIYNTTDSRWDVVAYTKGF